ncbi:MAG TPA: MdtA/MuxA family multidrug efflux RND transporter periplasmic adaptor subunit [Steroidobacteraceae bacterium]|nr:MdtA/MuxA family multidrug efflux RND transporter periplasmic adaptor subunit [Steroidobacteraceae bacterium]
MAPDSGSPLSADPEQHTRTSLQRRRVLIAAGLAILALIALLVLYKHNSSVVAENKRRSDASRPIPVRAATAVTGSVARQVTALGTVAALNTVTVHSRVDGPLIEVPFHEGQLVKGGDLLARIDPRTFQVTLDQAVGQLAHDQAQLADARIDLDRYTGLLAKDSIARQQVDSQMYMVRQLEGTVGSDQAQVDNARLQLEFTRITAPFAGRVGLRQIDPGNMIHSTDTNGLVVLTQTEPITVIFAVPSSQLAQILPRWREKQDLPVEALDRDGKVLARGQLAAIDNQIDVTTGTVKLKALFPNGDDSLFPSQFVNARLTIETLGGQTLIPSAAIQRGAPGTFVYVVGADNTVSQRPVTTGPSSGEQISITSGIKPGERVVIDGVDKLRDGSRVTVGADGKASP